MRKDSECFFGALKGRFRSLKIGCRLRGPEACDRLFRTCVALHNYLLHYDGLDRVWINGVHLPLAREKQYDGDFGHHDAEDLENVQQGTRHGSGRFRGGGLPSVFERILGDIPSMSVEEFRRHDSSATIFAQDPAVDGDFDDEVHPLFTNRCQDKITVVPVGPVGGAVHEYHGETFREILVTHWEIAWQRGDIQWPERDKTPTVVSTPPSFG